MEVLLIKRENTGEIQISGRIDSNTTIALEEKLLEQAKRFESIILDFSHVPYISSAGLRTIMKLYKEMRSKGGKFQIKNVRKDVADIFQVTGFAGLLDIEDV